MTELTVTQLVEKLAAQEHDRWSRWMRWMLAHMTEDNLNRWKLQMATDYADLSETEKQWDREEAKRTMALLQAHGLLRPRPVVPPGSGRFA